jgi:glutaredoxin 3
MAGTEHDVEIRDTHDPEVAAAACGYGIRRLPAVVIDGRLADWCAGCGLDEEILTQAIFG